MKARAWAMAVALCFAPTLALAQTAAPTAAARSEAQQAHRRGLALFDRKQHAEALTEFERAYAAAPTFRILYNIGLCHAALGDTLAAVDAFSAYLREAGDKLPADRRSQVESEIARLTQQLAKLSLTVDEAGADVSLDAQELGRGPFTRELRLNAGTHSVSVRSSDGTLKTQSVSLPAGSEQQLHFQSPRTVATPSAPLSAPSPRAERREVPWLAWGITGALGAATAVTGALALSAHADEKDVQRRQGIQADELESARNKVENLALATDILLASTVLAAGASLYLTLRPPSKDEGQTAVRISPGFIELRRSF